MAKIHPEMYFKADTKICALIWTPNDQILAGTSCGQLQLWDCKSQKQIRKSQIFDQNQPILWIAMDTNENSWIIQARFSPILKIVKNFEIIQEINMQSSALSFCKGDIFQNLIAVPSGESNCELLNWKTKKSETIIKSEENSGFLGCLKISSEFIFLGYENGLLKMVEKSTWQTVFQLYLKHSLLCMDLTEDFIALGTSEDCIYTVKIDEKSLKIVKNRQLPTKGISSLNIRQDRKILVCGSWDSTIRIFSWLKPDSLKPLGALKFHQASIDCIATKATKPYLFAAGSGDGYISVWNVYN